MKQTGAFGLKKAPLGGNYFPLEVSNRRKITANKEGRQRCFFFFSLKFFFFFLEVICNETFWVELTQCSACLQKVLHSAEEILKVTNPPRGNVTLEPSAVTLHW